MRKLILLAAMAAVTVPAAASAQRHDEMRRDQVRHDQHDRYNRHGDRNHRHASYIAPYRGWNYRPVTVGYQLRPAFYGFTRYLHQRLRRLSICRARALATLDPLRRRFAASECATGRVLR